MSSRHFQHGPSLFSKISQAAGFAASWLLFPQPGSDAILPRHQNSGHQNFGLNWRLLYSAGFSAVVLTGLGSAAAIAQSHPPQAHPQFLAQAEYLAQAESTASVQLLFINPSIGNDTSADGSQRSPYRTITQALEAAQGDTVLMLAAGTYSAESGETFPLALKPGITLQGDPTSKGRGIVIRGGGEFLSPTFASQNVAVLGVERSSLIGVTVSNPNPRGYGLWIESSSPTILNSTFSHSTHDGISVTGNSAPTIRGNAFAQNGANGITIYGTSRPEVRDNSFERTGFGINVAQDAAPVIVGNRITNNQDGIVVQANARPVLQGNTVENNQRDGLVAIAQSFPNLGTANAPGGNVFSGNGRHDVNAIALSHAIPAFGNQITAGRTAGNLDLAGTATPPATVASAPPAAVANAPTSSQPRVFNTALTASTPHPVSELPPTASSAPTQISATALLARPPAPAPVAAASSQPAATTPTDAPIPIAVIPPPAPASPRAPSPTPTSTAINIPVPPPDSAAVPSPAPLREVVVTQSSSAPSSPAPSDQAIAIEIPVPAPEATTTPPPSPANTVARAPNALPSPNPNLLPVPGTGNDIPLGNIAGLPTVSVSRDASRRAAGSPPTAPNRAAALGLRYRVVVEANDENAQAQVRSLVPGAFRTYANGRTMMQVGAYSDRYNADETAQMLNSNGLRAMVQQID